MGFLFIRCIQSADTDMKRPVLLLLIIVALLAAQPASAQEIPANASPAFAANPSVGFILSAPSLPEITSGGIFFDWPEIALLVPLTGSVEWQVSFCTAGSGRDLWLSPNPPIANDPDWFTLFADASGSLLLSNRIFYNGESRHGLSSRFGVSVWTVLAAHEHGSPWEILKQFSLNEGKIGIGLLAGVNFDVDPRVRISAYMSLQYAWARWSQRSVFTGEFLQDKRRENLSVPVILELAIKPF